jgi:LacI family transcriptional regulator
MIRFTPLNAATKDQVSLRQIAEAVGVSRMTVSRAFKSGSSVRPELRERILKKASEMGYAPDTMVSELMTSFASRRLVNYQETFAVFWWPDRWRCTSVAHTYEADLLQGLEAGARLHGRKLDHLVFDESKPPRVIERMLEARNILGGILTPPPRVEIPAPDLDWSKLSMVTIGTTLRIPRFHRAQPGHYSAIVRALEVIRDLGYRRPCLLERTDAEERMQRAYTAAFLAWERNAAKRIWHAPAPDAPGLEAWLKKTDGDVLIADCDAWRNAVPPPFRSTAFVSLGVSDPEGAISGIHQNTMRMAKYAVDLLVQTRLNHELGEPVEPVLMITQGIWVTGKTCPPAQKPIPYSSKSV